MLPNRLLFKSKLIAQFNTVTLYIKINIEKNLCLYTKKNTFFYIFNSIIIIFYHKHIFIIKPHKIYKLILLLYINQIVFNLNKNNLLVTNNSYIKSPNNTYIYFNDTLSSLNIEKYI